MWLLGSFMGLPRWLWGALGLVLALILVLFLLKDMQEAERADDALNREVGGAVQREQDLTETVERVEKANETRNEVSAEAAVGRGQRLYDQCLRSASPATRDNCKRFLPSGQEAGR